MTGLIQMNSRYVLNGNAQMMIAFGVIFAVLFAGLTIGFFMQKDNKWWLCMVLTVAAVALAIVGNTAPRVKEIRACAVGAVSLEEVAVKYDIVEVNGKELTLRER